MYRSGVGRSQTRIVRYVNGYSVRKEGMNDLANDNLITEKCKVILLGDAQVGKTSLKNWFFHEELFDPEYEPTIVIEKKS